MTTAKSYEGHPNPQAATYEIDADLLGPFQKIIVSKTGELKKYCPLAETLFGKKGVLQLAMASRIDIIARDGKTYVGVTTSKLAQWDDDTRSSVERVINDFLSKSTPAVLTQALQKDITAEKIELRKPFEPSGEDAFYQSIVTETFNDHVRPILKEDGGDMEVLAIEIKNGKIDVDVGLVGSCNDCPVAKTGTLQGAKHKLEQMLVDIKAEFANDKKLQTLSVGEITIEPLREAVFARPGPSASP